MPPPHPDVRRAAVLLDLLTLSGGRLRYTDLEAAWRRHDLADGLGEPDSVGRARRKAIRDLRSLGYQIEGRSQEIRLINQPSGDAPGLEINADEAAFRQLLRRLLDGLDPNKDRLPDPMLAYKDHVGRDRLVLGYGEEREAIEGVPYGIKVGDRTKLLIRTADGDRAVYLDAVRSIRVDSVGVGPVTGALEDPPVIEADRTDRLERPLPRGRPTTTKTLRDAHRLIATTMGMAGAHHADGQQIPLERLSVEAGMDEERVVDMLPIASFLSGFDLCEYDGQVVVYPVEVPRPRTMSGSDALAAWLDATAIAALDGATAEMGCPIDDEDLQRWIDRLTTFLSRMQFSEPSERYPLACNVVAASVDGDVLGVRIAGDSQRRSLEPDGLAWIGYRWWVQGRLDGACVGDQELLLDHITAVDLD